MKMLVLLAFRNLLRHSRRTLITVLAVTFATLLAIAMRGIQLGVYEENIAFALRLFSGFIQIQAPGYNENPSLRKSFVLDESTLQALNNIPQVQAYAPRLLAEGLVSYQDNSLGAALVGVVPEREKGMSTLIGKIREGRFFTTDTTAEVVLGDKMLHNLKAHIGDEIVILSQCYDGTLGNEKFRIVGTVKTGISDFDGLMVFTGLRRLQHLLEMQERVHVVALSLENVYEVSDVHNRLMATLDTARTVALSWEEVMPDLKQSIELDNISGIIFLGILIVVVAFGILNTILMSVTERFREFGVLLSLGMQNTTLVWVVLFETLFITLIGAAIGNILALVVNYYFMIHPIELGGSYAATMEEYGFLPLMRSTVNLRSFMNTTASIVVISLLATLYPLHKTYRLEPLKGIRYT